MQLGTNGTFRSLALGPVALSAGLFTLISPSYAQCVTGASVMTCSGTPDGFDGNGTWALGLQQSDPRTVINNGTLAPDPSDTGVMFYRDGWTITNNGTISKNGSIGSVVFISVSSTGASSTLNNTATGSITSSNSVGSIVAGYSNKATYNLTINNSGQIYQSTGAPPATVTNPGAVYLGNRSYHISINNEATGSIIGGDGSNGFHSAISSNGQIDSIVNAGLIKGVGPSTAAIYAEYGSIGTVSNSGTILANGSVSPVAMNLRYTTVQTLRNLQQGLIESSGSSGADAIDLTGTKLSTLENLGRIVSAGNGIVLDSQSSITSIQNLGTISAAGLNRYGIRNEGSIGTLVNGQSNLSYYGELPDNYLVKIDSPSSYGQLAVTSPGGTTNFGIYSASTITPGTVYSSVISGVSTAEFQGGVIPAGRYGTGAMITQIPWYLSGTGDTWDLVAQATPVQSTDPVVPTSSSGTALANAVANAAVVASNGGPDPTLANGTTLSAATQNLASADVDTLANVHAEGYSSNMTILMERMAGITNATMDRIHSPTGTGGVPGKYVWGEVSGYHGSVDSYDNLAGFNYDVFDIMAGVDVYRGSSVTMGVFGGGGSSDMTESAQVDQSYDSTNLYAGLYGAAFLPNAFKLSGSAGYMYSNTDAQRDIPDIGNFTGGTAKDSYSSNGAFGALKLSRPVAVGAKAVLTPFIAQSYSQLWVGDVNENGGNDFNFDIKSSTAYSTVSFVGLDAVVALSDAEVDPFSFVGSVRYGYDWLADDNASHEVTASSPIYGDFVQVGANMGPNSLQLAAGLQGGITDSVSLRAGVVGQLNNHGNEIGAGARLRIAF